MSVCVDCMVLCGSYAARRLIFKATSKRINTVLLVGLSVENAWFCVVLIRLKVYLKGYFRYNKTKSDLSVCVERMAWRGSYEAQSLSLLRPLLMLVKPSRIRRQNQRNLLRCSPSCYLRRRLYKICL